MITKDLTAENLLQPTEMILKLGTLKEESYAKWEMKPSDLVITDFAELGTEAQVIKQYM